MNNFGKKLKELREQNNLTQEELATMLYVSDKTISSWECNRTTPDIETYFKISTIFNIGLYTLLGKNYYNEKPLEIELKLKVSDTIFKNTLAKIQKFNPNYIKVQELDTYFKIPHKPKEKLRIRKENNQYILGYKKENKDTTRIEYETIIDNYSNLEQILLNLGFKKLGTISKNRLKILYQNKYEFSFDDVKDIGLFIEIEVKKFTHSNIEELEHLKQLLQELNLDLDLISTKKYSDYLEE